MHSLPIAIVYNLAYDLLELLLFPFSFFADRSGRAV
jgi:hypothetical protein